ncbi:hypothetical protein LZ32DRAFT_679529 [Colletotrichum eremochloae]|nr:hypothetical protein LZ32DRAFT_679529 [Colletotrichum eremochloae]
MAGAFLEDRDNGRFFWPADGPSRQPDTLRYPDDKDKIRDILHQLFWRENTSPIQRSTKNLQIKIEENPFRILDGPGSSFQDPIIIVDSNGERPSSPQPSPRPATLPRLHSYPRTPEGVSLDQVEGAQSQSANGRGDNEDRHQDYGSPSLGDCINRFTRALWPSPSREDPLRHAPIADMRPSTGHPEADKSTSARTTSSKRGRKRSAISRHAVAGAAHASGTGLLDAPLIDFREGMDNPRITTESTANEGPAGVAGGTANPHNDNEVREQENCQSAVRNIQLSLAKGKATLVNPSDSLQTPSPAIASSSSEVRDAEQVTSARRSDRQGKAQVQFMYRVISHHPRHESRIWKPKGRFQTKTLADLESELSLDLDASHTKLLRFTLEAPGVWAEQSVNRGREDEFDIMKQHFLAWILKHIAKKVNGDRILVQIEIEALTGDDSPEAENDEEASDIEW